MERRHRRRVLPHVAVCDNGEDGAAVQAQTHDAGNHLPQNEDGSGHCRRPGARQRGQARENRQQTGDAHQGKRRRITGEANAGIGESRHCARTGRSETGRVRGNHQRPVGGTVRHPDGLQERKVGRMSAQQLQGRVRHVLRGRSAAPTRATGACCAVHFTDPPPPSPFITVTFTALSHVVVCRPRARSVARSKK